MAMFIMCDVCKRNIIIGDPKIKEWRNVSIKPIVESEYAEQKYQLCRNCSEWLMKTIDANIAANGYAG